MGLESIADRKALMIDAHARHVVPEADWVEEVVAIAEEVEAAERAILAADDAGMRLDEARRAGGYHALQSRAI